MRSSSEDTTDRRRRAAPTRAPVWLLAAALCLGACGRSEPKAGGGPWAPPVAENGRIQVQVIAPSERGPLLDLAVDDLRQALRNITGAAANEGVARPYAIHALVHPDRVGELGPDGYILRSGVVPDGRPGVSVEAATETGAAYGLYRVIYDLGLRYYHPESRFTPNVPGRRLPWTYDGSVQRPRFEVRGFHEHTQHPIPMSDYYLRPDPTHREAVTRYLQWLARNRQNAAFFHMLKTVDLEAWLPWIEDIAAEAAQYGIGLGLVTSFADQQQNNFKIIDELDPTPADAQIRQTLNRLLERGFRYITFQIGTSEFTKPADEDVLSWLNTATSHIRNQWPDVRPYAWIHITCELKADGGGYFFHLPLQADADLGAWVHTTMFYTVDHPAPVYGCDDFRHQKEFLAAADGAREQVWFPETAWWLGFDNNAPVILPITGWSREYDIREGVAPYDVSGHITFTTGREWTYWQYDHYVAQVTFDGDLTWRDYLGSLKEMYGQQGDAVVAALRDWTELQRRHLYEENPELWFYIAGELPQDEIGKQAGVFARPPKVPYNEVHGYGAAAFAEWKARDFDMLQRILPEYGEALQGLPEQLEGGTPQQTRLFREAYLGLYVTHRRIAHAIALYASVIEARAGDEPAARQQLAAARAITAEIAPLLIEAEGLYRSPLAILARDKPESLTSYPFGYLAETSTAYFWHRRDDQLEDFLDHVFSGEIEAWSTEPDAVFVAGAGDVAMLEPNDPVASAVIASFIPRFLFGQIATGDASGFTLLVAEDANGNELPDVGSEQAFSGIAEGTTWTAEPITFAVVLRDNTGALLGELDITDATLTLELSDEAEAMPALLTGSLSGRIGAQQLVDTIVSVGGIDEEGVTNLVKNVYGVPGNEPLPETLPLHFTLALSPAGGGADPD